MTIISSYAFPSFPFSLGSYETAMAEEVTKSIMGKVYTAAFNNGFQEGFIKGFAQAKEAYNKR